MEVLVMKQVKKMFRRTISLVYYGVLFFRISCCNVFFKQLKHQIYSRSNQVGFTLNLQETDIPEIEAKIKYTLKLASKEDMDEVLQKAKSESKDMIQKLIYRKMLYEDGYHNCYIARTADTNEICFMQFTIFPDDDKIVEGKYRNWFPKLKKDEAIIEGAYTFEKFRGNRLHPAITVCQLKICKEMGIQRMLAHVEKDNIASVKGTERVGYVAFEEVPELKIMFLTFRRFSQSHRAPEEKSKI
jgi:hypothetical protein